MYETGYLRILLVVTADTVASFVKDIILLSAHFLVPDFDYSYCSFFYFLLWAAISAFYSLAVPPSYSVSLCLEKCVCL